MRIYILILTGIFISINNLIGQNIDLTDHLIYPRLDTAYWEKDYDDLNSNHSLKANKFQTCVFSQTDSTRSRFCFNTTKGHVQIDTTLHNLTPEKLFGEWSPVNFGIFEVIDSIALGSQLYDRQKTTLKENKDAIGSITFSKNKVQIDFRNIDEIPNNKMSYTIIDGKYLMTKELFRKSGSTILGITKDDFLILDDHTYKTFAKKDKYFVIKTTIRRIILKRV